MQATAKAHANIALVKYWGKRDKVLNLPAAGSLSLTLSGLDTTTTVTFRDAPGDTLTIAGVPLDAAATAKMRPLLDEVRKRAGITAGARVESHNSFPTGAGLASSASGMAALALAATSAAGLVCSPTELSELLLGKYCKFLGA